MIPIVELPEIVKHYSPYFERVFSEEALVQFQRYLSGLIVCENKSVEGINRLVVYESRSQSSLNRLLSRSPFSARALNEARQELLSSLPETRPKPKGVLSVDDTLLTHYGQQFDKIAYLYDPSQECYVWAHNLVSVHYSDELTDYPFEYQLWEPADLAKLEQGLRRAGIKLKASKAALKENEPQKWRTYLLNLWRRHQNKAGVAELYHPKLTIALHLLARWVEKYPELKLPVTFDNWYTQPAFCRFIDQTLKLPYVGTLASSDMVILQGETKSLADFAEQLKTEHLDPLRKKDKPLFRKITITYKGEKQGY